MLKPIIHQWQIWLSAVSFFTRLPVPASSCHSERHLSKVYRYFSLIGLLIGGLSAMLYALVFSHLPAGVAITLVIITGILLTGGLHEDGLADICDGLGGGFDREQKLAIMKDSAVGAYGTMGLILLLLLKFQLLLALSTAGVTTVVTALLIAHITSRCTAESIIYSLPYARPLTSSKVGGLFTTIRRKDLLILLITALPVLLLVNAVVALSLLVMLLITRQLLVIFFRRQLGGHTGDCLGAAQQLLEVLCYLLLVIISSHQLM